MLRDLYAYMRTQGTIAAILNAIINPALAWLGNRRMEFASLWGDHSMVLDTAATAVILSLLVSLFVTAGVRRELAAGRLAAAGASARTGSWLSRLPSNPWALGLSLGVALACILVAALLGLFQLMGIPGLSFAGFALFKVVYTSLLGVAVTRWVIRRQVLAAPGA